jgi:hypothetical protein
MHILLTYFHLYSEKTCFVGQSPETSGNAQNKEQKRKVENTFLEMRKGEKWRSPP